MVNKLSRFLVRPPRQRAPAWKTRSSSPASDRCCPPIPG